MGGALSSKALTCDYWQVEGAASGAPISEGGNEGGRVKFLGARGGTANN